MHKTGQKKCFKKKYFCTQYCASRGSTHTVTHGATEKPVLCSHPFQINITNVTFFKTCPTGLRKQLFFW
uniref:Uncharacterized protein n=1 Tax=Anguilla anguilla TaxID=7936 RepID=A0A0E9X582_ANGAN